ncbi:hypothetical protein N7474_005945 [Penicillium riverlandense]|uniref:uncharacterized protein n=1 Tax=Penicillium riverlandense TaxID=1903569 RepID=UPI002547120E|nr:uncharacterized protein N7474_005945 [Penicillium riverlandense]KAJ5820354.1 hypothetical protein N7474_005945 [Penicillium riverlandense]
MHLQHALVALVFSLSLPVASVATSEFDSECFSDPGTLENQGSYNYQSPGYCQAQCRKGHFTVAALSKGKDCWCGHDMPPKDKRVKDSKCNVACAGWPADKCGGHDTWSVFSTGDAESGISNNDPISASTAAGGIVVAPTGATATVPNNILTAPAPAKTTAATASVSAAASSSRAMSSSRATTTVTPANSADTVRPGSSVLWAAFAALGLLL